MEGDTSRYLGGDVVEGIFTQIAKLKRFETCVKKYVLQIINKLLKKMPT